MKTKLFFPVVILTTQLMLVSASAEQKNNVVSKESGDDAAATYGTPDDSGATVSEQIEVQENTLDACSDGIDNDADTHVDCDDQDCSIYAVCVKAPLKEEEPAAEEEIVHLSNPEYGSMCRDGKDNNEDGLIDCHETSCQRYRYCKRLMYETPEPRNKAPGLLINFSLGVALPNFRTPTATTDEARLTTTSTYSTTSGLLDVPFDPDVGGMASFKIGYLPLKWLGVGINHMGAITAATNQSEHLHTRDDPDKYKYHGYKISFHIGGFLRFQWPFSRFVPYLDIAMGYSRVKYKWQIYDPDYSWDAIRSSSDDDYYDYTPDPDVTETQEYRHFTLALEPGFDVFVSRRRFAIGLRAWLPVIAADGESSTDQSSTDNIGIMLSLTLTPMWRERPRLKPEYDAAGVGR